MNALLNDPKTKGVLSPREMRTLMALQTGPKRREEIDRAAGVSNGPDLILTLRTERGLEIPCERVQSLDRDGRPCKPGVYRLSTQDRPKVRRLLSEATTDGRRKEK